MNKYVLKLFTSNDLFDLQINIIHKPVLDLIHKTQER